MKTKIIFASIFGVIFLSFGIWSTFSAINHFRDNKAGFVLQDGKFYTTSDKNLNSGLTPQPLVGNAWSANLQNTWLDNNLLKGNIILQSIGVDNAFSHDAKIIPPTGGVNVTRTCWKLSWTIETKNSGKITLTDAENAKVRYNPVSGQLEGYGYNRNLGNVWLGMDTYCADDQITDEEIVAIQNDNKIAEKRASFIGKVKIIGNIGSHNTISGLIYDQEKGIEFAQYSAILNQLRNNIFLRSRNLTDNLQNKNFNTVENIGENLFYINSTNSVKELKITQQGWTWAVNGAKIHNSVRSIIVIGGDVVISTDIAETPQSKIIFAIKNDKNLGGNIFIHEDVKKIYSSLIAENSIFSGEGNFTGDNKYYNDAAEEVAKIPQNQLYVKGIFASRNTIGGASKNLDNPVCPYLPAGSVDCKLETAQIFDLNYFRNFDNRNSNTRAYGDTSFDDYSLIIEYDEKNISNAPDLLRIQS